MGDSVETDDCYMPWARDEKHNHCIAEGPEGACYWLIGLIGRGSCQCWAQPIPNRAAETMIPIICGLIEQGANLMTDALETYHQLDDDYDH